MKQTLITYKNLFWRHTKWHPSIGAGWRRMTWINQPPKSFQGLAWELSSSSVSGAWVTRTDSKREPRVHKKIKSALSKQPSVWHKNPQTLRHCPGIWAGGQQNSRLIASATQTEARASLWVQGWIIALPALHTRLHLSNGRDTCSCEAGPPL